MDENLTKGGAILYAQQLLEKIGRLYELIAIGYFPFQHPNLVEINGLIVHELKRIAPLLDDKLQKGIYELIPDRFDPDLIYNSWKEISPKLYLLKIFIEQHFHKIDFSMPNEFMMLTAIIDKKLDSYAAIRNKYDADRLYLLIKNEKDKNKEQLKRIPDYHFNFIKDDSIRLLLISFYNELRIVYFTDSIRTPIILCGAIIESLLKLSLKVDEQKAKDEYKQLPSTKGKTDDIEQWRFDPVIDVSFKLNILPKGLENQIAAVRNFRNFVHIDKAIKLYGIQLDNNYKDICINSLYIVTKHVEEWFKSKNL